MADPFGNIPLNINGNPQPTPVPPPAPMPAPSAVPIERPVIATTPPIQKPAPIPPAPPIQNPAPIAAAPVRAPIPMPPIEPIRMPENAPITKRMPHHTGVGPIVGAVIIVALFIFGGLYFWGAHLNAQEKAPLPLISGDASQQ